MFNLSKFYLLAVIILISGCATTVGMLGSESPFGQFYVDQTGKKTLLDQKDLEIPSGDPELIQGTNVYEDDKRMVEDNYRRIGYSLFSTVSINQAYAVIFGRTIHASAVILYAPFTPEMYPENDPLALADFQQKVKEWQALASKPKLPEEARRFRVLADDAIQNKEFAKAAGFYEKGLAVEPMWPAGQYNASRIYEELKNYGMAAMHMKRYLELKPDVQEARLCQDKIYVWQEKAKEAQDRASATHRYNFMATYWIKGKPALLGILLRGLNAQEGARSHGDKGVVVIDVVKNSPAFGAGVYKDDIIKKINGSEIVDPKSFLDMLKENSGKMVILSIDRDGQKITKSVQLNPESK